MKTIDISIYFVNLWVKLAIANGGRNAIAYIVGYIREEIRLADACTHHIYVI
ncbi:hypothetical protein [Nostoc sp. NIES-3756]|uniref:hypothetical protein n=1 Tax=Nostoc sp. NIES-3756 TaxID=1751286 RepID=UPI0014952DF8|nr:hypothetical protein [Nostoc sp. NIES-3756]